MLRYEWKKQLLYRRSIWLIAVFLAAEVLGMLLFTRPYDQVLEENRAVYESYLCQVEGPLTEEKRESIEAEMERLNAIHREMEQLKQDYYSSAVTEAYYRGRFAELVDDEARYPGFSKLYSQYIFVRGDAGRSFLYTGGWEVLLGDQEPDYLLLLLIILVVTPIFCEEYACRMHEILLTQKKSAKYQVLVKVAVALILTGALTALLELLDLAYCAARFGLPHGEYSLQSLVSFGATEKRLTLWQAFWLRFAIREVGYLYAAVLMLFLSVLLKKFSWTLMAGVAVLPVPFLTADSNNLFLRLPAPWALTLGSVYFNSSISSRDALTGETVTLVREVAWPELWLLLGASALLMALMLYCVWRRNTNWQLKKHRARAVLSACVLALLLAGCGNPEQPVLYNSSAAQWYESGDYIVMNNGEKNYLLDQGTSTVLAFPLDAMAGETVSASGYFYGRGSRLHYLKTTTLHPSAGWDSISQFSALTAVDLETLAESVVYPWNEDRQWFFGLLERPAQGASPLMVQQFFIHGNSLFYIDSSGAGLCRMDLTTGKQETYLNGVSTQDIAYDGTNLYYADAYNRLTIHDLDTGQARAIDEVVVSRFVLTPEGIYFLNRRDGQILYHWDAETGTAAKLNNIPANALYYDAAYLWIAGDSDGTLYRLNHDGSGAACLGVNGRICGVSNGEYIYLSGNEPDCLLAVNKETLECREITLH